MKYLKDFGTSLTIGSFFIMSITGILLFFHMDVGVNKLLHKWCGLFIIIPVALHVIVNFNGFKRYFTSCKTGKILISLCLSLLCFSFFFNLQTKQLPPHVIALRVILNSTVSEISSLTHHSEEDLKAKLLESGIKIESNDQKLKSFVHDNKKLQLKLMKLIAELKKDD